MKNTNRPFFLLFLSLCTQMAIGQNNMTELEAQNFMQKVLWFCNYDYNNFEDPKKEVSQFFEDSIQTQLKQEGDKLIFFYKLDGAIIHQIDLPWVEVLSTNRSDGRNWCNKIRFKLKKQQGQLYLVPNYRKDWHFPKVSPWLEEEEMNRRLPTVQEKTTQRADLLNYLENRYSSVPDSSWKEEDIWGDWTVDRMIWTTDGVQEEMELGLQFYFLENGVFYNASRLYLFYKGQWQDHPGWWFLWKNKLIKSDGARIEIFTLEERTTNTLLYSLIEGKDSTSWVLTNLPEEEEVQQPIPIEHPEVEVVLQPKYDNISLFYQQRAIVKLDGKSGMIDHLGKEILPTEYEEILPFYDKKTTFARKGEQWTRINLKGEAIDTVNYEDIMEPLGVLILAKGENGKVGVVDTLGNTIIPCQFDMISLTKDDNYKVYLGQKTGLLNNKGDLILKPIYDDFRKLENSIYTLQQNNKWGIWNTMADSFLLPPTYDFIFERDKYYQVKLNGKTQFLHKESLKPVGLSAFERISYYDDNRFGVEKNGKYGIIDIHENILIPIEYEAIEDREKAVKAKKNGLWGLLDKTGNEILPFEYEEINYSWVSDNLQVKKEGKYGIITQQGTIIVPIIYEQVSFPSPLNHDKDTLMVFKKNGKSGYINLKNEVVIPAQYDYLYHVNVPGFIGAEKQEKQGVINMKNEVLVPFIFDHLFINQKVPVLTVEYQGFQGLIKNPFYQEAAQK